MNAQSNNQRVKKHYQKMKDQGFKQIKVWIPADREFFLKEVAEAIREGKKVVIHNEESPCRSAEDT